MLHKAELHVCADIRTHANSGGVRAAIANAQHPLLRHDPGRSSYVSLRLLCTTKLPLVEPAATDDDLGSTLNSSILVSVDE